MDLSDRPGELHWRRIMDFQGSMDGFLNALMSFVNELLNAIFGWLAQLFNGISIT